MFTGIIKSRGKIYKLRKIKNGVIIKIYSNIKINSKKLASPEPNVEEYLAQSQHFTATTGIKKGLSHSDIQFLFVATPKFL